MRTIYEKTAGGRRFFAADILTITEKCVIIVLSDKMIICLIIYFERIKNMEQIKSGDSIDIEIIEHTEDNIPPERKIEITDKDVLARLSAAMPGLMNFVTNTATAGKMGQLYEVRGLVKGMELAKSGNMPNAFRGIIKDSGGKIIGQANLVNAGESALGVANAVSSVMNVASMIVGQYYMSKLSDQLGELNAKVDEILERLEDDIRAEMKADMKLLRNISVFVAEIFENDDERNRTRIRLDSMEKSALKCLEKVNTMLQRSCDSEVKTYADFEKKMPDIERWRGYQNTFYEIMYIISELDYLLSKETKSRERCNETLSNCFTDCQKSGEKIKNFGEKLEEKLHKKWLDSMSFLMPFGFLSLDLQNVSLDLQIEKYAAEEKNDKIREFALGAASAIIDAITVVPSTIDRAVSENEKNYQNKYDTILKRKQAASEMFSVPDRQELYGDNFNVLAQDGKLYYLKP